MGRSTATRNFENPIRPRLRRKLGLAFGLPDQDEPRSRIRVYKGSACRRGRRGGHSACLVHLFHAALRIAVCVCVRSVLLFLFLLTAVYVHWTRRFRVERYSGRSAVFRVLNLNATPAGNGFLRLQLPRGAHALSNALPVHALRSL